MDITYLGHSSFRLRGRTATVVTDPFDPKMVGLKYSGVKGDIVTVSHEHADHNMSDLVKDTKRVVSGPGEYEISGVSIIGMPTFHDSKKGEERGKNTVYIFEMDSLRLSHLGDLGHKLTEKMMEEIGYLDVLMIPVGGFYTIGPSEAAEITRSIEAKITIPMHYKVPGLKPELASKLEGVDSFLSETSLVTEKMTKLSLKRNDLGEEQKIVVLERK